MVDKAAGLCGLAGGGGRGGGETEEPWEGFANGVARRERGAWGTTPGGGGDVSSAMGQAAGAVREWQASAGAQVQGAAVQAATDALTALEAHAKEGKAASPGARICAKTPRGNKSSVKAATASPPGVIPP